MKLPLPQSLTAQFALVVSCLAALVAVVGATTIYSLTGSAHSIRQLAEERLTRLADAQDRAEHTLTIERLALQSSRDDTVEAVRETHRQVLEQLASFDGLVDHLAPATASNELGVDMLALYRSSQRFRNIVNIEAQVRETALAARAGVCETVRRVVGQHRRGSAPRGRPTCASANT
ncbi:multi-sensor hybrid histidine kinase [Paraburkholderia hospita]|uniref:Multi-sensor hybrid histidine kinase n=1 Tax=Paraburkholderia hospita TaxID=169430 RepID=A0ABN0FAW5_9BURK|nr:sensor histidine kinase [Paraburkholderia hospita]EIM95797.1 multi-sensor hybrid histidine kinase [Paraburkholderia hospita]